MGPPAHLILSAQLLFKGCIFIHRILTVTKEVNMSSKKNRIKDYPYRLRPGESRLGPEEAEEILWQCPGVNIDLMHIFSLPRRSVPARAYAFVKVSDVLNRDG